MRLEGGRRQAVYAKVRADERGALIHRSAVALAAAGVPLAEPLGYLPDLRLMLASEVAGTRLRELRGSPRFAAAMEPVAEVLARLHACRLPDLATSEDAEAGELRSAAGTVAALLPGAEHASRATGGSADRPAGRGGRADRHDSRQLPRRPGPRLRSVP